MRADNGRVLFSSNENKCFLKSVGIIIHLLPNRRQYCMGCVKLIHDLMSDDMVTNNVLVGK
jgi:hypothetical protein